MSKDPISDRLKRAQAATLGRPLSFRTIGIEIDDPENPGQKILFCVREPTQREKADILKAATDMQALERGKTEIDSARLRVEAMVKLTFLGDPVLGTDGKPELETYVVKNPLTGKPVLEEVLDAEGRPELDDDGKPVLREKTASRPRATVATNDQNKPELAFAGQRNLLIAAPDNEWVGPIADAAMELFNRKMEDARKSP
jgi:hypothetical protein